MNVSTINRILGRKQPKAAPVQELALGTSAPSASPLAVVSEPIFMEPATEPRVVGVEPSSGPVMGSIPAAAVREVQPLLAPEALAVALAGTPVEQSGLILATGVVRVGGEAGGGGSGRGTAASQIRLVTGTTPTWVNLPGAKPLFCVSGEFNEGFVAVLPNHR